LFLFLLKEIAVIKKRISLTAKPPKAPVHIRITECGFKSKNKLKKVLKPFHVAINEAINPRLTGKFIAIIIAVINFFKNFIFHRSKINKGLVIPEVFKSPYQIEVNYDKNGLGRKLGNIDHFIFFIYSNIAKYFIFNI
jgi:hypothetical protein